MKKTYQLLDSKSKVHEYDFEVEKISQGVTVYRLKTSESQSEWAIPGQLLIAVEDAGNGFNFLTYQNPNQYDTFTELSVFMNCIRTLDTNISEYFELRETNPIIATNL